MANDNNETQEQQGIQFEDIQPWYDNSGDTGLSARLKLKRNFDKIKAVIDAISSLPSLIRNYLSRVNDDTAEGEITFKKGLKVGTFRSRFLGSGAAVDPAGNAEFESIYSRSFISAPEFVFNRIKVTEGEVWCTNGYGDIEDVKEGEDENGDAVVNGGLITLHLDENDYASVQVGDICRGIYNDIAGAYETATVDDDVQMAAGSSSQEGDGIGFSAKRGFFTSYFYIERMVKNRKGECQFIYKLRSATTPHPCAFMKFAQYGSFTNAERRASKYESSINHYYKMILEGVSTWQIQSANIVSRSGYLGDMEVELADHTTRQLQGYGLYVQNNVYFGSAVVQLDPYTLEMLERDLTQYDVNISGHISAIQVDNHGYVIGGIYTETTEGGVTTRTYRIHSAITVRRNGTLLTEALADAEAGTGTYKITYMSVGCTCVIENSTLYITSIDNLLNSASADATGFDLDAAKAMERCRVDLIIDCEGRSSIQKSIDIAINHDGQDGKGVEYIFITQEAWDGTDADKPTIYDVTADRQVDDYCPYTDAQQTDQWTDEPTGVGDNLRYEFYAQRKQINGVWQPFGEVKLWNRYVTDGVTPYIIDLSNEQSLINCDENGNVLSGAAYETSKLMIFLGQGYAFEDFAITVTPTNIKCNGNSSAFTLTAAQKAAAQVVGYFELVPSDISANSATIAVSAVYGNIILNAVYKINKNRAGQNGVVYSLLPSLDTIRKNKSGSIVNSDATLTLQVKKTVGASASILTTYNELTAEGLSLKYVNADGTTALGEISKATSTLIGSGAWVKIELWKSSVIADSERINVVFDGIDGDDGDDGSYYVKEYAVGNSRTTAPTSGWNATQPSPSDGQYVWERSRLYNPNTGTYGSYVYVCLTGKSGSNGARGRMYHIMGEYNPDTPYTLTDDLCPIVYYNGSYYYLKQDAQGKVPTNTTYWGSASSFEMVFTKALFAAFAELGGFIVWNNWFISRKGTVNGVAGQTINDNFNGSMINQGNNFIPYLALDAGTGDLYSKKGSIGGFVIADEALGTNYSSGNVGGTYIRKDGYMRLYNKSNYVALSVMGGFELLGNGVDFAVIDNIAGTMCQRAKTFNINTDANPGNKVNIGGTNTDSVNINGDEAKFGSSTPVSIGNTLAVSGLFSAGGNIKKTSFTLPTDPKVGQFYFCKGVSGDITVTIPTGNYLLEPGNNNLRSGSVNIGTRSDIILYLGDHKWTELWCG